MSPLVRVATLAVMAIGGLAMTAGTATAATPTPTMQDTQFLQQAHQTNLAEIAAGKLAQQKGHSPTVKNLGAMFMTDHTNLDKMLMPVARQMHVTLPSTPNSHQQAVAAQLKKLSGPQFDKMFVQSQYAGHKMAIRAGQMEIAKGTNQDVVNVARQSASVLESHRTALQDAGKSLGVPLPTASPGRTAHPHMTPTPMGTAHS